jgi:hypothetical protein
VEAVLDAEIAPGLEVIPVTPGLEAVPEWEVGMEVIPVAPNLEAVPEEWETALGVEADRKLQAVPGFRLYLALQLVKLVYWDLACCLRRPCE